MADYKHGVYGQMQDAVIASAEEATSAIVAIGTLPVHLAADTGDLVGVPIPMDDASAKSAYGYSANWASFTLCEVMQAFLGGSSGNIGGLYCVNVLDPSKHRASEDTEAQVTFMDGIGTLNDELAILSTIKVAGVTAVTAAYDNTAGTIAINAAGASGAKTVTYRRVNVAAVTASDIVAAVEAIDDIYPEYNAVPNLLIAPGWSDNSDVYAALVSKAQAIDGHFKGFVLADIPTTSGVLTSEQAIAWKAANNYTSKFSKVCWPCVRDASGVVYHISTLFAREMGRNDALNDGVPYVTASNTSIPAAGVCLADGTAVKMYIEHGNALNAYGISTAIAWGGAVRLWGGHTAGYLYGSNSQDASAIFDTNIRMLCHIINAFQLEWIDEIDEPMSLALQETIIFSEQARLDGLVAMGALVGTPTIAFIPSNNAAASIVQGEFVWNVAMTPTPQFKTAQIVVAYTTDGFDAFIPSTSESEGE